MPNYIKLGNLRIEIPEPANNGGGGGGGGESSSLLTGLLAFYNFEDATDASGNGVSLTNDNGVTFSAGKIGNAANFNGGQRLRSNYQTLPASVSFWLKANSFSGYKNMFVVSSEVQNPIFLVQGLPGNNFRFYSEGGSSLNSSASVADNQWHHIVVNATAGQITLYVDGVLDATASGNLGSYSSISQFGWGAYPHDGDFLAGQIDAGGFWSRALTSAEITELYNAGAGKEHPFA